MVHATAATIRAIFLLMALALSGMGAGCSRHIDVIDFGDASTVSGAITHARVRVDLTASTAMSDSKDRPRVKLFREETLVYSGPATTSAPIEIVDLDPGRYRLVVERLPDAPHLDIEHGFDLPEARYVSLVYEDAEGVREFWDGVGDGLIVTAKVMGIVALVGGCVALDAAIIAGACCCGWNGSGYTPITLHVIAALTR